MSIEAGEMDFTQVREAFAAMLRREIPSDRMPTVEPHPPESVQPPCIYIADGRATVDVSMQIQTWDWTVPLNILVANIRDYPTEQAQAEGLLKEIVPILARNWNLEWELRNTGIQLFGLRYDSVQEGGIRVGSQVYAGISINFKLKVKFPVTLSNYYGE